MKTGHTPGPWKVDGEFIVHEEPWITTSRGMAMSNICQVRGTLLSGTRKANARLIAATPTMASALKLAREELDKMGCDCTKHAADCPACSVREALKMAGLE